jgi:chromosomal replication initiation ATPase DnaA
MRSSFICPECGHRSQFTPELMAEIFRVVCRYYEEDFSVKMLRWPQRSANGRSRNISAYFCRMFTGELYKVIADALGVSATNLGNMISRVELAVESDPLYAAQVRDLEEILIKELSNYLTHKNPDNETKPLPAVI